MGGEIKMNNVNKQFEWHHEDTVQAMAYDIPITGFNTFNTNNLRLWRSKPCFDNQDSEGEGEEDLVERIDKIQDAEYLTSIYYPNIPEQ